MRKENWKVQQIITETVKKVLSETSRRQKATAALNGSSKTIRTMAILTSENPRYDVSADGTNKNNNDRRENLEKDLKLGHYAWFSVKGQYEGKENSYIVYNNQQHSSYQDVGSSLVHVFLCTYHHHFVPNIGNAHPL